MAIRSFLPDDEPVSDAALDLAALDAEIASDGADMVVIAEDEAPPLGRTLIGDFAYGSLLRTSRGGLQIASGEAALRSWIDVQIHCGGCKAMPKGWGVANPTAGVGEGIASPALAALEDDLRQAILRHPRITAMVQFQRYEGDDEDDAVEFSFVVITDDDSRITIDNRTVLG